MAGRRAFLILCCRPSAGNIVGALYHKKTKIKYISNKNYHNLQDSTETGERSGVSLQQMCP